MEERHLQMESHHDGDETKGSFYSFVQDYIEAREASRSVRTAGLKDLTVTGIIGCPDSDYQRSSVSASLPVFLLYTRAAWVLLTVT